jgi:hypothetical protein
MMPFCRECGKEIDNEWVSCPFCSAKLSQVQSEDATDNFNQKVGKNLDLRNGKPTGDWSSVFHNGKLIQLIASDDGYYYWADEEWHEINLEEDTIEESKDEVPIQQEAEERSTPSTFNPPSSISSPSTFNPPSSRSSPSTFNPPSSRSSPSIFNPPPSRSSPLPPPPLPSGYPPAQSSKTTIWEKVPFFWKIWTFAISIGIVLILLEVQLGLVDEGLFMGNMIISWSVLVMLVYVLIRSQKKYNLKKKEEALAKGEEVKESKSDKIAKHIITTILGFAAFGSLSATKQECSERFIGDPPPYTYDGITIDLPAVYEEYCYQVPDPNIGAAIFCFSLIIIIEVILPFLNWIKNRK